MFYSILISLVVSAIIAAVYVVFFTDEVPLIDEHGQQEEWFNMNL